MLIPAQSARAPRTVESKIRETKMSKRAARLARALSAHNHKPDGAGRADRHTPRHERLPTKCNIVIVREVAAASKAAAITVAATG
jgi:hypothetical protein